MRQNKTIPLHIYSEKLLDNSEGLWIFNGEDNISYTPNGHALSFKLEEKSFWYNHRNTIILETLQNYPAKWILDVGGGTGFVSAFLQKNNIPTVLLEPVLEGALISKKRNIKQVICSTLETVEFYANSLPAISLFDTLEHIELDKDFLTSCHKLLQPDGRIYITVPAYQMLWSDFDRQVGHFRRYTIKSLANRLKEVGFEVEFSSYFFYLLPPFIWLIRAFLKRDYQQGSTMKKQVDHGVKSSFLAKTMTFFIKIETFFIKQNRSIPFGSSCLVVAKKKRN